MFMTKRRDFSRPLPALHSVAEPVASTRWQIFFTVLSFKFFRWYAATIAFARNLAHRTSASSFCRPTTSYPYQFSLKTCFVQKLSKFNNKELVVLLFINTTSQMTSLTVRWLLVILNHWKNFEQFSCTGFGTKFLTALKSLGAKTVMPITTTP